MLHYLRQTSLQRNSEVDLFVAQRLHSGARRDIRNGSPPPPIVAPVVSPGAFCWTGGPGGTIRVHGSGNAHQTQKNLCGCLSLPT